jgi:hypothetical protein
MPHYKFFRPITKPLIRRDHGRAGENAMRSAKFARFRRKKRSIERALEAGSRLTAGQPIR